jgi:hypothetical protein
MRGELVAAAELHRRELLAHRNQSAHGWVRTASILAQ